MENETGEENFICVRVTPPITLIPSNGQQYLKYGIEIETNDSSFTLCHSLTWRRYSEFQYLQKVLKKNHPNIPVPNLPPHGIFKDREHPVFLETRRSGLEEFLKTVLSISLYKADKALHLFLQTSLSTNDILFNLVGRRHDKVVQVNLSMGSSEAINNNSTKLESKSEEELEKRPQETYEDEEKKEYIGVVKNGTGTKNEKDNRPKKVTFCDEVLAINLINCSPPSTVKKTA